VIVPPLLRSYLGQTHLRRTLRTSNLEEANRRKFLVVAELKQKIAELQTERRKGTLGLSPALTIGGARDLHEEIELVRAGEGSADAEEALVDIAVHRAEEIERLRGEKYAKQWYSTAVHGATSLSRHLDAWLASPDGARLKEQTKAGHRQAFRQLLEALDADDLYAEDVGPREALRFLDWMAQRKDAYKTQRRKLASLGGLWQYMERRLIIPRGANPWTGHRLTAAAAPSKRPARRIYADAELLALLKGPEVEESKNGQPNKRKARPTDRTSRDLLLLGMVTGCRIEELCALKVADVERTKDAAYITIRHGKTAAATREVPVVHPAALSVLDRRLALKKPRVFPELTPGGPDDKYSAAATKAFGRYRRACGVPDGPDFHSLRRVVITLLERRGVEPIRAMRFVGHEIATVMHATYSAGLGREELRRVAEAIRYAPEVEAGMIRAT